MKKVVLGVTGSMAAYKAVDLASLLVKQGCEVHVVLTEDALRFITPLPFKTLSRHPVVTDLYEAFLADPGLLPPDWAAVCGMAGDATTGRVARDYIAGMTDNYALEEYGRVFHNRIDL